MPPRLEALAKRICSRTIQTQSSKIWHVTKPFSPMWNILPQTKDLLTSGTMDRAMDIMVVHELKLAPEKLSIIQHWYNVKCEDRDVPGYPSPKFTTPASFLKSPLHPPASSSLSAKSPAKTSNINKSLQLDDLLQCPHGPRSVLLLQRSSSILSSRSSSSSVSIRISSCT